MSHFVLSIHTRTGRENAASERAGVARLLHQAAQEIGSGAAPTPLKDGGGHEIGSYEFGPGMICGPGKASRQRRVNEKLDVVRPGFDEAHRNVPSVLHGGKIEGGRGQ